MNRVLFAAALIVVFARSALSAEPAPMEITAGVKAVAHSNNEFATARMVTCARISRATYSSRLTAFRRRWRWSRPCANGDTATEMTKVLHLSLPEPQLDEAIDTQRKLLASSAETPDFQLRVANRLWGQKGVTFVPRFLQVLRTDFRADLGPLDFQQTEIRGPRSTPGSTRKRTTRSRTFSAPGGAQPRHAFGSDQCHLFQGPLAGGVREERHCRRRVPNDSFRPCHRADDAPDGTLLVLRKGSIAGARIALRWGRDYVDADLSAGKNRRS